MKSILAFTVFLLLATTLYGSKQLQNDSLSFNSNLKFIDFKVLVAKKKKAQLKFSSNLSSRHFKTVVTKTYAAKGINFAGHYCFIYWGCGSPCQNSVLVDVDTGMIYDGLSATLGYDFEKESRMMIINPPSSTRKYHDDCEWCVPEVYVWSEQTKKFDKK